MTRAEKRAAVQAVLDTPDSAKLSDREVARRCGVSGPFVRKVRYPDGKPGDWFKGAEAKGRTGHWATDLLDIAEEMGTLNRRIAEITQGWTDPGALLSLQAAMYELKKGPTLIEQAVQYQLKFLRGASQPPPWSRGFFSPVYNEDFRTLGLQQDATPEQIKAAYRRLVKEKHPDRGGTHEECARINAAYNRLTKQRAA